MTCLLFFTGFSPPNSFIPTDNDRHLRILGCAQVQEEMLDLGEEMCSEELLLPSVYEEVLRRPRVNEERKPEFLWLFSFVADVVEDCFEDWHAWTRP